MIARHDMSHYVTFSPTLWLASRGVAYFKAGQRRRRVNSSCSVATTSGGGRRRRWWWSFLAFCDWQKLWKKRAREDQRFRAVVTRCETRKTHLLEGGFPPKVLAVERRNIF